MVPCRVNYEMKCECQIIERERERDSLETRANSSIGRNIYF